MREALDRHCITRDSVDRSDVTEILEVPTEWSLVAYLCVGYPQEEHIDPELERYGWQTRDDQSRLVLRR